MRLIASFADADAAKEFSYFLIQQKIANQCEYTEKGAQLWILHEEDVEAAKKWHTEYLEDPHNHRFKGNERISIPEPLPPPRTASSYKPPLKTKKQPVTSFILILCILLFITRTFSLFESTPSEDTAFNTPAWASPVYNEFLYEYPSYYEHLGKLLRLYTVEELSHPETLPEEGRILLGKLPEYAFWPGYYDLFVEAETKDKPFSTQTPQFVQISQGEVWRLFTPCLLHSNLLHIFFNMFWLLVLGPQLERILGAFKYIVLIILVGAVSNTFQYLMGGPIFIGFSGVIAAMLSFTWVRQKRFPWEGYRTSPGIFVILTFSIFLTCFVQMISFYLEISGHGGFNLGIANTAHIAGFLVGLFLGRLNVFKASSA